MSKNVFTEMSGKFESSPNDGGDYYNPHAFRELVRARRSVRKFTEEAIPDHIVDECLEMALLAPNSSNLQTWEFYRIKTPQVRIDINTACFSQPAAATASELIICVARPANWRAHCKQMLAIFKSMPVETPKSVLDYYSKLMPMVNTVGPLSILAPLKWLMYSVMGLFKVVPRGPLSYLGLASRSVKSCALACENLMLAFRAHGFDTCPMEGFDAVRVKKAMKLNGKFEIVMIIGAGKRAEGGLYGPRIRFPKEQFLKTL